VIVEADSPVVRAGLETMLRADPDIEVMTDAASADLAVFYADDDEAFDNAIESAEQIPAVILSDGVPGERIARALRSNVRAVLPREASEREIAAAVRAAAAGLITVLPGDVDKILAQTVEMPSREALTPREVEVLRMIADGESNKRIAWRLRISEHTVKFHVASILAKMDASTRAEAVAIGIRRGLVYV
jgi:DNA-binding NarL/FixJ family response regulator